MKSIWGQLWWMHVAIGNVPCKQCDFRDHQLLSFSPTDSNESEHSIHEVYIRCVKLLHWWFLEQEIKYCHQWSPWNNTNYWCSLDEKAEKEIVNAVGCTIKPSNLSQRLLNQSIGIHYIRNTKFFLNGDKLQSLYITVHRSSKNKLPPWWKVGVHNCASHYIIISLFIPSLFL